MCGQADSSVVSGLGRAGATIKKGPVGLSCPSTQGAQRILAHLICHPPALCLQVQ